MAPPNTFVHSVYVAALAFEDHRRDDPGELYLTHALDVAQALGPDTTASELSTAVLHDVLEDTDWTKDDLAESGVEAEVLQAVETLTRRPDEDHEEFVARICATRGVVGLKVVTLAVTRGRDRRREGPAHVHELRAEAHHRRAPGPAHCPERLAFRCLPCRHAARRVVVDDSARAFWLRRYTDEEIATMAAAVSGREPDLERIARERRRLAGALAFL